MILAELSERQEWRRVFEERHANNFVHENAPVGLQQPVMVFVCPEVS